MMATTTRISISVKPAWDLSFVMNVFLIMIVNLPMATRSPYPAIIGTT
jgi:hypothetical protein